MMQSINFSIKKAIYKLINQSWLINLLAKLYKILFSSCGEINANKWMNRITAVMSLNLNPIAGKVHLHHSRFYWKVMHSAYGKVTIPCKQPIKTPKCTLNIGIFGHIASTLLTQEPLFRNIPENLTLYVFDLQHQGEFKRYSAKYLLSKVHYYEFFEVNSGWLDRVVQAINASQLDMVINVNYNIESFAIIDRLETPCIVHLCSGTDLFHHEKIAFHLNAQPQNDYFTKNYYLFSTATQSIFNHQMVFPINVVYDTRDLLFDEVPLWEEREPVIFWHGSLYKFASLPYLEILMQLLVDDRNLNLIFTGRDDQSRRKGLKDIMAIFKKWGVENRTHYAGRLRYGRNERGEIEGDWQEVREHLKKSRLWPDTFPTGGGAARAEAYAAGTPSVHLGVNFDESWWNKKQWNQVELPALLIPQGTAYTLNEYKQNCRNCLYDKTFANTLIEKQRKLICRYSDGKEFWLQVVECYRHWYNMRS